MDNQDCAIDTRCGYVAIVGRPNVGKSTLLNRLMGQKISITSHKPQTTRCKILGIKTLAQHQIIYIDTPGIHKKTPRPLNRYLNEVAQNALSDVDVIVFIVAGLKWLEDDEIVLRKIIAQKSPVILVVNKVDKVVAKTALLPSLQALSAKKEFVAIVPLSAKNGTNVELLETTIKQLLPRNAFFYPSEMITDITDRFFAAEIIREKIMRLVGQELPYEITVVIDDYKEAKKIININATIFVERLGQKAIVIGRGGELLKKIGTLARIELERHLATKVCLKLWVKVKSNWADELPRIS